MLQIINLEKSFGNTKVLKNINIDIKKGEFLTLVGESGSGKSTLLRIIAGLEEKTSGKMLIGNVDISNKAPKDRDFAMVFQSYALYPHLSVKDNLSTPLVARSPFMYKLPFATKVLKSAKNWRQDIDKKVDEVAKKLQISHLLSRKPRELSGGQCQRVALGRAMIRNPIAFLMDEPLSNLDAKLRVHMRNELTTLHRELGITFIYVTHDQVEAMTMSSRIAFLVDGNLLQIDTPDEMYNNPNHIKVAEFIGTPKINTAKVCIKDGEVCFDAKEDFEFTFAIRPEFVGLDDKSKYKAVVQNIENMGSEYLLHTITKFSNDEFVLKVTPELGKSVDIGDTVGISLAFDSALFFAKDGQRVFIDLQDCQKKSA